ncbi:MAG: 3-phosphoshikimate 1-carboxyvinyltransferase [Acutalibacteraceae bacterium]
MRIAKIYSQNLEGEVEILPSKSYLHRAIICASLSGKLSRIYPVVYSDDVLATINAMRTLGATIDTFENHIIIRKFIPVNKNVEIDCFDSGSTLRFLIPLVATLGIKTKFILGKSLSERPIEPYLKALSYNGLKFKFSGSSELLVSGKLVSGEFFVSGGISSQFVSGLMMALPLLKGDSKIILTSELESCNYVNMTVYTMEKFGVNVKKITEGYLIPSLQKYMPCNFFVEGDWSQAAFFLVAAAVGGKIILKNLNNNSIQGDKIIADILSEMGANISYFEDDMIVSSDHLKGITIDAKNIPDLVPVICVAAIFSEGITKIHNVKRLKFKECDRLNAICEELKKLGANITSDDNCIIIRGGKKLHPGSVWSHNDHRILMSLVVAANQIQGVTEISDIDCVKKSYPDFFRIFRHLGGLANVIDMGK